MGYKIADVSVAIAALNEQPQLDATIACIRAGLTQPREIVVYDDYGKYPSRPTDPSVRYIRSTHRIGSGPAKHAAAEACTSSLIVVMDGHCRPAVDWLDFIVEEHRLHPWAVLAPVCVGIESGAYRQGSHRGMGGRLVLSPVSGFWEVNWNECKPGVHSYATPTVVGGCYAASRAMFDRIGGYAPAYFGYGMEEEYLGLRAWITGGECRVVPRSVVGHWFNRFFDRATEDDHPGYNWEQHYNRHVAAKVCFGEDVYRKHYKSRLDQYGMDPLMYQRLDSSTEEIAKVHDLIQQNRTVPDAHLAEWCGVSHPS